MQGNGACAGDHPQKGGTEAFQLFRTNPRDLRHLVQAGGPPFGHLDQGPVRKHDIGGHACRFGQRAALCLKRRQKRRILVRDQRPHDGLGSGRLNRVAPQRDAGLAAQDRACGIGHAQRAVPVRVGADQIAAHHLAEDGPPGRFRQIASDGEGGQLIMAAFLHLGRQRAGQDVDQMARTEPLAGAQHCRQSLAHRFGCVEQGRRAVAQVAIAARL